MSNEAVVAAVVVSPSKTYDFNNYTLNVSGNAKKGKRSVRINVPILDDKGNRIDSAMVELSGADFNTFWTNYTSDKQVVAAVLKGQDTTGFDDSIVNVLS